VTLRTRIHPTQWLALFDRDRTVRLGRGRANDVRVGHQRVQGRWTVSTHHAEIRWDGTRWSTLNVSDKPGLLHVYEPGWEEVPLEPGRPWVPVRHRWAYAVGRPGHRFHVVCSTDDHRGPAVMPAAPILFGSVFLAPLPGDPGDDRHAGDPGDFAGPAGPGDDRVPGDPRGPARGSGPAGGSGRGGPAVLGGSAGGIDVGGSADDATAGFEGSVALSLTPLERAVLLAYYSDFTMLPRPPTLAPRSHEEAARRLGRSKDSTRKAIERVNDKIGRAHDAPPAATGRTISSEVGRWLARIGAIDPD
jgi:hypothetical protein